MGVYIKIPNVKFTKYIGVAEIEDEPIVPDVPDEPSIPDTYPETDSLKGLYYFGGTVADSLVNRVEGGENATIPSSASDFDVADGYATFTGGMKDNRISTNLYKAKPSAGLTMIALLRVSTEGGARSIFSTLQQGTSKGVVLTNKRQYGYFNGSGTSEYVDCDPPVISDNFAICAWSVKPDGLRMVKSTNGGIQVLLDNDWVADDWTNSAGVTIGGGQYNVGYASDADIALASIHEGVLTDEQLRNIFAYVRYYGESKRLTIE